MDQWDFRFRADPDESEASSKIAKVIAVQESKYRFWRRKKVLALDHTLSLLDKGTDYLTQAKRNNARSQLLTLICSKVFDDYHRDSKSGGADFLSHSRWWRTVRFLHRIRDHVLVQDQSKGFKLSIKDGAFVDIDLVERTALFLDTKFCDTLLSEQRYMEMLQDTRKQSGRYHITKRRDHLIQYRDLFSSLGKVMRRATEAATRQSAILLKKRRMSRSQSFNTRRSSKDDVNGILERLGEAMAAQEKLITTLVLMGYGNASQLRATLKHTMHRIRDSNKEKRSPGSSARPTMNAAPNSLVIHRLSEAKAEEIKAQMTQASSRTLLRTHHIVRMCGINVMATELDSKGGDRLQGFLKSQLLFHQQVSKSRFIISLFGVCQPLGFMSVTEKVVCTLEDIYGSGSFIGATPRRGGYGGINRREHLSARLQMRLALETAAGLEVIHNAEGFHGNLCPQAIGISTAFTVKLMDFNRNPTIDEKGQNNAYIAPEFFTHRKIETLPLSELMRKADVYSCGAVVAEIFSSERRRLRAWLPPDLASSYSKIEASLDKVNPRQVPSFRVGPILEPRRPDFAGFLSYCLSICAEHRPEIKKVRHAFHSFEQKTILQGDTIYLDTFQCRSLSTQLIEQNKINHGISDTYRVNLSGIPAHIKVLGLKSMKGDDLKHVQSLMLICSSTLVCESFGCAPNDRLGWVMATELISHNLFHLLSKNTTKLNFYKRLRLAIDMADALSELHTLYDKPYHLDLTKIFVTTDYRIKFSPYTDRVSHQRSYDIKTIDFRFNKTPPEMRQVPEDVADGGASPISGSADEDGDQSADHKSTWTIKSDIYVLGAILLEFLSEYQEVNYKRGRSRRRAQSTDPILPNTVGNKGRRNMGNVRKVDGKQKQVKGFGKIGGRSDSSLTSRPATTMTSSRNLRGGSPIKQNGQGGPSQTPSKPGSRRLLAVPGERRRSSGGGGALGSVLHRCVNKRPKIRPTLGEIRESIMAEMDIPQDKKDSNGQIDSPEGRDRAGTATDRSVYEKSSRRPFATSPSRSRNVSSRPSLVSRDNPDRKRMLFRKMGSSGFDSLDSRAPRLSIGEDKLMAARRRMPSREGSVTNTSLHQASIPTLSPRTHTPGSSNNMLLNPVAMSPPHGDSPRSDHLRSDPLTTRSNGRSTPSPRPPKERGDVLVKVASSPNHSSRARKGLDKKNSEDKRLDRKISEDANPRREENPPREDRAFSLPSAVHTKLLRRRSSSSGFSDQRLHTSAPSLDQGRLSVSFSGQRNDSKMVPKSKQLGSPTNSEIRRFPPTLSHAPSIDTANRATDETSFLAEPRHSAQSSSFQNVR